ncbi:MAG: aminopeptidase P family protein [Paracoccaceae bacterium]
MFQSFDVTARPEQGPGRLLALRGEMTARELDAFLVPRADAHQGEYVAPCDDRLAWLTGFTGSAGFCIVLAAQAGVFIDGRYRTQVKSQVDLDHFTPVSWPETQPGSWLKEKLPSGSRVGFDAWLYTSGQLEKLTADLEGSGIALVPCDNLVDTIWADQPEPPMAAAKVHPLEFAGETHGDKRARLAKSLEDAGHIAAVLTLPDSICWLLNIRGADIPRNPVVQCFAVLHVTGAVALFIPPSKVQDVITHLGQDVSIHKPDEFLSYVNGLEGPVLVDKATIPVRVADQIETPVFGADPCALPKACKNAAEIAGQVEAHLRDGAAIVELLTWLDAQPVGSLRETQVVSQLEGFRRKDNALQDISFETISGTGPNGAIMHYRVTHETDAVLDDGHLLVLDSGGQYLDGTTDITRTIAIGSPPEEAAMCFTRVLQGMIGMSRLRWPKGLAGRDIEMIGRLPLWLAGQDFDHGLGHGVGAYLSVHEGPQRLSKVSDVPLAPGMILSNEPGYYREGAFGIRIENLLVVQEAAPLVGADAHRKMLDWQTLTFAPIDKRLIVKDMLTPCDMVWLDTYHRDVLEKIGPRVTSGALAWLKEACAPL